MEDTKVPMMDHCNGPVPCAIRVWDDRRQKYGWSRPAVLCDNKSCEHCAWNHEEARRRSQIPLTVGPNGLRRRLISHQPTVLEETETEGKTDG